MASRHDRAHPRLLNPINHFQFVALTKEAGKCGRDLVGHKGRAGLHNTTGFQIARSS